MERRSTDSVRATVSQQQPAYLAKVLGLSDCQHTALQAIAQVPESRKTYVFWDLTDRQSECTYNRRR